jgi:hypothetical protein
LPILDLRGVDDLFPLSSEEHCAEFVARNSGCGIAQEVTDNGRIQRASPARFAPCKAAVQAHRY